jgi:hypothetical protein
MTRLSYLPLVALSAAFVALVYIAFAGVRRGMLSTRSRTLLLITAAVLLVGTVPLAIRAIWPQEDNKPKVATKKFDVAVDFSIRQANTEVVRVPFTAGSGSVNIGCAETRSAQVQYVLPPGAEQPTATAQWVNTNNIESQSSNVVVQPTVVTAVGNISGLHRTFLLNCPGGGHGELLLRGEYSAKHELPATPVVIKALHDVADNGQVFTAALPQVANSQPVIFKATVSDAGAQSSIEGVIRPAEKGGYELKITARNGALPHDVRVVGQTLVMTL